MENPEIEKQLRQIQEQLDLQQYEQMSKIDPLDFTDLDGSSTVADIASALNSQRDAFNSVLAEMKRINFMQTKG